MKRTIIVTAKNELRSGTSASGRDWTLWELSARDPATNRTIDSKLKSFDPPEQLGVPVEVEFEPDEREENAFLVKAGGAGGGGRSHQLAERLETLEAKVDWLTQRVLALDGGAPAPDPNQQSLVAEDDEDIPF